GNHLDLHSFPTRRSSDLEGIELVQADVSDPAFSFDRPVDVVVMTHVLEHLEEPLAFLHALQRIDFKYLIVEVPLDDLLSGKVEADRKSTRLNSSHSQISY